jgi:hypothetical protein
MVLDNSLRFMKAAIVKSKSKRLLPHRMSKSIGPSRLQSAGQQMQIFCCRKDQLDAGRLLCCRAICNLIDFDIRCGSSLHPLAGKPASCLPVSRCLPCQVASPPLPPPPLTPLTPGGLLVFPPPCPAPK